MVVTIPYKLWTDASLQVQWSQPTAFPNTIWSEDDFCSCGAAYFILPIRTQYWCEKCRYFLEKIKDNKSCSRQHWLYDLIWTRFFFFFFLISRINMPVMRSDRKNRLWLLSIAPLSKSITLMNLVLSIQGTKSALCPCRQVQEGWFSPLAFWSMDNCFPQDGWSVSRISLFPQLPAEAVGEKERTAENKPLPASFLFLALPCPFDVAAGICAQGQWKAQAQRGLPRSAPEPVRGAIQTQRVRGEQDVPATPRCWGRAGPSNSSSSGVKMKTELVVWDTGVWNRNISWTQNESERQLLLSICLHFSGFSLHPFPPASRPFLLGE